MLKPHLCFFFYLVLVKVLGFKSHIWQIPSGVRPTILGLVLLSIRVMVLGSNPECPWSHQKSQVSSPTFWICPFSSYFSALTFLKSTFYFINSANVFLHPLIKIKNLMILKSKNLIPRSPHIHLTKYEGSLLE